MLNKDNIIATCQAILSGVFATREHQPAELLTDWMHHESRHHRAKRGKHYVRYASRDDAITKFLMR